MLRHTGGPNEGNMQVKLAKDWFDPEGVLRRKVDGDGGTYVPGRFKKRLPKSAEVVKDDAVEQDEPVVDQNDPNLLKNHGDRRAAEEAATRALAESAADIAEKDRLQKLVDDGKASPADKHKLKKLIEKLGNTTNAQEGK